MNAVGGNGAMWVRGCVTMRFHRGIGVAVAGVLVSVLGLVPSTALGQSITLSELTPFLENCDLGLNCRDLGENDQCTLLNSATCTSEVGSTQDREVSFIVRTSGVSAANQDMVIWVESEAYQLGSATPDSEKCIRDQNEPKFDSLKLETDRAPLGSAGFNFPADLTGLNLNRDNPARTRWTLSQIIYEAIENTTQLLDDTAPLTAAQCTETSGSLTVRLCVAIGNTSSVVTDADPRKWFEFAVDLDKPSPPQPPSVTSRDSGVQVSLTPTSVSEDDVERWEVIYRQQPTGADAPAPNDTSCTWAETSGTCQNPRVELVNRQIQNATENIGGLTNGIPYEFCVRTVDRAANRSDFAAKVVATPQDECDFIECYPGDLRTGCSATALPMWALLALGGGWVWRRRQRGLR